MSEKKNPLGPTGENVRRNVARLRGGLQYKDLAERLATLGRPIPALGLRRIEAGERRVDADDLVALAVALGVSPLTLLLPEGGSGEAASKMTGVPDREVGNNVQWYWARGDEPLEIRKGDTGYLSRDWAAQVAAYYHRALPPLRHRADVISEWEERGKAEEETMHWVLETQGMSDWTHEDLFAARQPRRFNPAGTSTGEPGDLPKRFV